MSRSSNESVVYLLFLYWFSGVELTLNGTTLTNNSIVAMTDIGTGDAVLLCTTTYRPCCSSANPETQWHFPNGSQVQNNPNLPYQRTRGRFSGTVILSRNSESTISGIFRCDIPDASGVLQSLRIRIYTCATGEFCTLCEWAGVCIVFYGLQKLEIFNIWGVFIKTPATRSKG